MHPFVPLFGNPHIQTIAGHFWRRPFDPVRFPEEARFLRTAPDTQVLVQTQRPGGPSRGHIVLVHGLEGSGAAGYMRSLAHAVLEAGYTAHRFHMRTCGGTERLASTLYHGGLTSDLRAMVEELGASGREPVWLVGFSLGGNVVLKLAGELGEAARGLVRGVCGVSTPLDLLACARRLARAENRIYEQRFVRRMRSRIVKTGRYSAADCLRLKSLREVDDRITAPEFGFRDAEDYYTSQSAIRYVDRVRIPALLLQAEDDTLIPPQIFESDAVRCNPCIQVVMTGHGGHLGFVSRRRPHLWADAAVLHWIEREDGTNRTGLPSTA